MAQQVAHTQPHHIRKSKSDRAFYITINVILAVLSLIIFYPLLYIVSSSFSSGAAITAGKVILWPVDLSLEGYKAVFSNKNIGIGYRNTLFYTVVGTTVNVIMTMVCAYPLSRKDMPYRGFFMFLFTFTMFFGGGIVPTYLIYKAFGMLDTIWVMTLPGCVSVYNLIIARTFFQSNIPGELLDAARIDGCDDFRFFAQIVVPLSSAIIAVVMLYQVVGIWNSYMDGLLYLSSDSKIPLQLVLREILVKNSVDGGQMGMGDDELENLKEQMKYCVIVVSTLPMMVLYPFVQKFFTKGVMIGSIKG